MTNSTLDDVYAEERQIDIYEVLGVSSDVSPVMAQAMYWARVAELRKEEAAGDMEARRRVAELNLALEIILDEGRRSEYDRHGATGVEDVSRAPDAAKQPNPTMQLLGRVTVALIPGAIAGVMTLVLLGNPMLAVLVAAAPVLAAALLSVASPNPENAPLVVLQLAPGATPDQIDLAYRTLVSVWLSRLSSAPEEAVDELERLDKAYRIALEESFEQLIAGGTPPAELVEGEAVPAAAGEPGVLAWASTALAGGLLRGLQAALSGTLRVAGMVLRPISAGAADGMQRIRERSTGATSRAAARLGDSSKGAAGRTAGAVERMRRRAAAELHAFEDAEVEEESEVTIDLERRLRASIQEVARQATEPVEVPEESVEGKRFRLVLESAVGSRRVPVDDHPVRIGPTDEADIVVAATDGAEAVDSLVWVSGGELVLHSTPDGLPCLVNGAPATWARLDAGDELTIGGTRLLIEIADDTRISLPLEPSPEPEEPRAVEPVELPGDAIELPGDAIELPGEPVELPGGPVAMEPEAEPQRDPYGDPDDKDVESAS